MGERQAETDKIVDELEQKFAGKKKICVLEFPFPKKYVGSELCKSFNKQIQYLTFLDAGL